MRYNCKLYIYSNSAHLQQLYAGFVKLFKNKYINLEIDTSNYSARNTSPILRMLLNNKYVVYYDTFDGYNYSNNSFLESMEIFATYLQEANYYFKRSYCPEINKLTKFPEIIYPLGLNFGFDVSRKDAYIQRYLIKTSFESLLKKLKDLKHSKFLNKICRTDNEYISEESVEHIPHINNNPKILFIARLWDPSAAINNSLKEEWIELNNKRIYYMNFLKENFSNNFIGGIIEDSYSKKQCKSLIIPSIHTKRNNFIKLMHDSDICIATTGLHKSIGWKLAEYVASSRAIVTEPLHYKLPGNFNKSDNYLEFRNIDEFANAVSTLLSSSNLRIKMMTVNYQYYNNYVRSENLILNTIYKILLNESAKVKYLESGNLKYYNGH